MTKSIFKQRYLEIRPDRKGYENITPLEFKQYLGEVGEVHVNPEYHLNENYCLESDQNQEKLRWTIVIKLTSGESRFVVEDSLKIFDTSDDAIRYVWEVLGVQWINLSASIRMY